MPQRNDVDEVLVLRAQGGSTDAFEVLVKRYANRVYGLVRARIGEPAAAEDVAQEVFLAAYRGLGGLRSAHSLAAWLHGIVRKQCARWLADRKRVVSREVPDMSLGSSLEAADSTPSPAESLEEQELSSAVWASVSQLPGRCREAVVLHYFEGMKPCAHRAVPRHLSQHSPEPPSERSGSPTTRSPAIP